MNYIVLARKYRPQIFDDVIGQGHITDILKKAVQADRLAHAYLFCGPRGIGKTSCARILAKSLNCAKGATLKPCGVCPACKEIALGNSFDVIEVDGASNRGIDEIRTLRENVKFAPSYGRYKIYIVDEVHMLTTEAFNALLKTLEEPPEYVKFILATTVPNKVPSTIISRCQRFDFRRISMDGITKSLVDICKSEKFKVDENALQAIAKAASGSLRDALSILDQLSALSSRAIKADDVFSMLGMVEVDLLFALADALGDKDCAKALDIFDQILTKGKDVRQLAKDLIEHFRNLMIVKIGGKALGRLIEYPVAIKEQLLVQCEKFDLKEILKAIDTLIEAQEMSRIMDSLQIPLEVAFAKLAYRPEASNDKEPQTIKTENQQPDNANNFKKNKPSASVIEILSNQKGHVNFGIEKTDASAEDSEEQAQTLNEEIDFPGELSIEAVKKSWDAVTHAISLKKMSVATFLQEGAPYAICKNTITISFSKEAAFHKETLEERDKISLIEKAFSETLKRNVRVKLKIVDDHKPPEDEPNIKAALDTFKGKVVNKWHRHE
ncbi:MAG: DNA polymerase III subunit gamma/tau [Candidatus Omnitrophota bacterium]